MMVVIHTGEEYMKLKKHHPNITANKSDPVIKLHKKRRSKYIEHDISHKNHGWMPMVHDGCLWYMMDEQKEWKNRRNHD